MDEMLMLIEYIQKAMSMAVYDKVDDVGYAGKIPVCPGVIAFAGSLYDCQEELRSVLEGWLIVKIRHGDQLPVLGKINLNRVNVSRRKVKSREPLASM